MRLLSPVPSGRPEGEPSTALRCLQPRCVEAVGGSNKYRPRSFQQPTTDAAAMLHHRQEQAAVAAVRSQDAANGGEVSTHHGEVG